MTDRNQFAAEIRAKRAALIVELRKLREDRTPDGGWYSYRTLEQSLSSDHCWLEHREFDWISACRGGVLDIGCADAELSLLLSYFDFPVTAIDSSNYNVNGLAGARLVLDRLPGNTARLLDLDLEIEAYWKYVPASNGLIFCTGVLYHLRDPLGFLRRMLGKARYAVISSRVLPPASISILPYAISSRLALFLKSGELNGDATNYWIPSVDCLRLWCERSGWKVDSLKTVRASPWGYELMDYRSSALLVNGEMVFEDFELTDGWHEMEVGGVRWSEPVFGIARPAIRPGREKGIELSVFVPEMVCLSALEAGIAVRADTGASWFVAVSGAGEYRILLPGGAGAIECTCVGIGYASEARDARKLGVQFVVRAST